MSTIYNDILLKRGFRELPYQKDFLTNPIYESPKLPMVLAAGTSSGKSFMSIMKLEIFYSDIDNKNKRTLYIPASKTVLRDNIEKELKDFNPSFTYCIATNKTELLQAIKDKCNVIVALPQTLIGSMDVLPNFHNFVLDEAHQWYFKSTIQNIIKKISPKYQLLLTGTPSRFIAKGDMFTFKFVPVMELYDLKQVTNVKLEVVSSSYDFKQSDYVSSYGNLKSNVRITDKESDNALMVVCKEMIKKLKNPIKGLHNVNRLSKNLFSIFGELDKTIIFCHSLKQADAFYNSLNSFKGLKGKVLVSHSENDKDSELFEQFRNDSDIKVLVAVDRGRLGYNMEELFNVVDFTMTQSLDMLLQMYGRLLRLSKTNKQKIYYKVANKNDADYNIVLMTAMMCLTDMKWYSKFNGKNMGQIVIPKVISNFFKKSQQNNSNQKSKSNSKKAISLEMLDIPLDLNLFNQSILHSNNDSFSTIGSTTLDDVRTEFFGLLNKWSKEKVFEISSKMKYIDEFNKYPNLDQASRKFGIRDEVIKHLKYRNYNKIRTNDEILKIIYDNKFEYLDDLAKFDKNLYTMAYRRGLTGNLKRKNKKQYENILDKKVLQAALNKHITNTDAANSLNLQLYEFRSMCNYYGIYKSKGKGNKKIQRPVYCIDIDTNKIIKEYPSICHAQRECNTSNIRSVCNGRQKTAGGYKWIFVENK